MGTLTADMTRLCGEMDTMRQARVTFLENLGKETGEMLANFTFARTQRALKTKRDLSAFVSNLKHRGGRFRDEVRTDLAGAHRAWFGSAGGFGEQPSAEVAFKSERKKSRQRSE